jgi:hypothetical protein
MRLHSFRNYSNRLAHEIKKLSRPPDSANILLGLPQNQIINVRPYRIPGPRCCT